jgi:hypothetical protein
MHPEDRVLVAVMRHPRDLAIARDRGWYRVPETSAPRGVFSEYLAFYFTAAFAEQKWAVHYYARNLGHELVTRRELLPQEPDHPRATEHYYKILLGPLQKREPPIPSLRWRRITFLHTTWDRFQAAEELNDLFAAGDEFVDRLYHALREQGLAPERRYPLRDSGVQYEASLALLCRQGVLDIEVAGSQPGPPGSLAFLPQDVATDPGACLRLIRAEIERWGGLLPPPGRETDRG